MFLLIGDQEDMCCGRVQQALRRHGREVVRTSSPLAAPFALSWQIDTNGSAQMAWSDALGSPRSITGVLLRPSARWVDPEGWNAKDFAYMQHETQAALIAWLWTLHCPVINRPIANLWFRPYRSYPEWHRLFAACGLPVAPICITNEVGAARAFGRRWAGRATYAPLTSTMRYPLGEPSQWDELAKLLVHVPVCLTAPSSRPSTYATVVGDYVVWDESVMCDVGPLNSRLVRLARRLGLDCVQIEIASEGNTLYCMTVDPFPVLERHNRAAQSILVDRLVECMDGTRAVGGEGRSSVDTQNRPVMDT